MTFKEAKKAYLKKLELYVPVVDRVHGGTHPEFHEVKDLFDLINMKIKESGSSIPDLTTEFNRLREVTSNYLVPNDVCESYEAVYVMLQELDKGYHS